MTWNWQRKDWPHFTYDPAAVKQLEDAFLRNSGVFLGAYQHISSEDKKVLTVHLISNEALQTSAIEGQILNRESVQCSIQRNFGLRVDDKRIPPAEQGIADMMRDVYYNYTAELTHETLFEWHGMVMRGRRDLLDIGGYRTDSEPMQIISGPIHAPVVHFEAPPSESVPQQMQAFIEWFNQTGGQGPQSLPALTRAAIAHLYFECIHPFSDGNGRIGRAIAQKSLSQSFGQPTLIALSQIIHSHKKAYYDHLAMASRHTEISAWVVYFAQTILEAQAYTQRWVDFLIRKTQCYDRIRDQLNERQLKVLARVFQAGPDGWVGGFSTKNYISITQTSRATATRDLEELVARKVFLRKGELKATRYFLNLEG